MAASEARRPQARIWRKLHISADEKSLEIRAIEVTSSAIEDAAILPDLLNQIDHRENITCVTADGAKALNDARERPNVLGERSCVKRAGITAEAA